MKIYSLLSTWVKDPVLKDSILIIVSRCLMRDDIVNKIMNKIETRTNVELNNIVILHACPEEDRDTYHGKISAFLKCAKPREIWVITREGSPHCFILHFAVNEAIFVSGVKIVHRHFVYFNDDVIEIVPDAVRVARYLHIVNMLVSKNPDVIMKLSQISLEKASEEYP